MLNQIYLHFPSPSRSMVFPFTTYLSCHFSKYRVSKTRESNRGVLVLILGEEDTVGVGVEETSF